MKNKSRLHRASVAAALTAVCIGVTACGGEVVGRNGDSTEVVSKAAVSGSGIFQKKDKPSESKNDTERLIAAIYPHTNSRFLYREKGGKIEQRDLEGKVIQSFAVPGLDTGGTRAFEIEWVSDSEILYNLYRERESEDSSVPELWCVPLKDTKEGEVLDMAGAEKLFEDSDYDICVEYADPRCILYSTLEPSYCREYDRQKKKKVPLDSSRPKARWCPRSVNNGDVSKFIVHSLEKSKEEYPVGVYVHEAGSGKVEKINECYGSKWTQFHGTVSDNRLLYTELLQEPQVLGRVSYDIWCYDGETGKNQILLPEKKWREFAGSLEFQQLWADGDRLYIEVFDEKDGDKSTVFSCSLADGKGLRWEEELNRYLHSYDDVYIIGIEAGRCFYEAGDFDKDGVAIYDDRYCYRFSSGENKKIEKNDAENWFWYREDEE